MQTPPEQPEPDAIPTIPLEVVSLEESAPERETTPAIKRKIQWISFIPIGLALIPALAVLLLYLPVVKHQFVWDDTIYLRDMPAYRNPDLWLDSLFHPFVLSPNYFRPLAVLTFVGELRLKGLDPALFHATNLLLHALNTMLMALLAMQWSAKWYTARKAAFTPAHLIPLLAACLYGFHPALIEGVAFISSRFDLLMTACLLLALLADGLGRSSGSPSTSTQVKRALLVGTFFLLAALAKEMAVAFALGLPFWHLALSAERSVTSIFKRNRWVYLAVLLAGGAYLGIRIAALKYLIMTGVDRSIPTGSILQHILLFCKSVANYLLLILWPFNSLSPIHYSRLPVPTNDASAWLAVILVVILLIGLVMLIRKLPRIGWLAVAGLLALLPVANLLPLELGGGAFIAERFLLFPMVFFALAAGILIEWFMPMLKRWFWVPAALWLVFSLATIQLMLPNWRDNLSLWTWAVKRAPRSDTPLANLSLEYTDLGQFQRGAAYAQQAINLTPENADAWDNFGLALFRMGEYADAQAAFDKAVSLEPKNALYWNNLAGSLREQDKLAEAAKMLIEQALTLDPNLPSAHLNLGIVYLKADRPDLAAQALQNAINLLPPADAADALVILQQTQEPDRWLRMGDLMLQNQQYETAAKAFDTAAQLGATYADAAVGFTSALIGLQDWQNAAQVLQQAIEKEPEDARLYNNLGVVAREQGDIDSARQLFSKALELKPQWEVPQQNLDALPRSTP
jgi:tetratricopeptide (TPR) repeat protein